MEQQLVSISIGRDSGRLLDDYAKHKVTVIDQAHRYRTMWAVFCNIVCKAFSLFFC